MTRDELIIEAGSEGLRMAMLEAAAYASAARCHPFSRDRWYRELSWKLEQVDEWLAVLATSSFTPDAHILAIIGECRKTLEDRE